MRLFIAINLEGELLDETESAALAVRGICPISSSVRRDNLHLTLAFLGECEEKRIQQVVQAMTAASGTQFQLKADTVGVFRRSGGDIWWIGFKDCPELFALQRRLEGELRENSFELERRRFVPHVTIARRVRASKNVSTDMIPAVKAGQTVKSIELMESKYCDGRTTYKKIESISLG